MQSCRRSKVYWRRFALRPFPGSTWGSKRRNRLSVFTFLAALVLLGDLLLGIHLISPRIALYAICLLAPIYLYLISLAVVWLETDNFRIATPRLIRDVAISILFTIAAFASSYWTFGIVPTFAAQAGASPLDCIYFSIVTFTTLGFGDFRPSESARMFAAFQALLGTIHVGLIVGAVFVAVGDRRR